MTFYNKTMDEPPSELDDYPVSQHDPSYSSQLTKDLFSIMEADVYKYWPTAQFIPGDKETLSFFDYSNSHVRKNPSMRTNYRRDEFRTFIKAKVAELLGEEVAESVYKQLETNHSVSTAQHYVTLTPRTLNPSLQTSLAYFGREEADRQNIIVFGCSGISFNNPWYARGHYFHSVCDSVVTNNPITFFGRSMDPKPVVFTKPYKNETKKSIHKLLHHYRSERRIRKREFNLVKKIVDEILFTPHILSQKYYVDQVTISNFNIWKEIFKSFPGNVPNFIFLSQEKLAAELIKEFHLETDTLLHKFLFEKSWHELILKYFNNIMCAFSLEREYGTFHFWAMKNDGTERIQLFLKEGILESKDKSVQIPLKPDTIRKAIEKDELLPSTMLTFVVLGMYYGFNLSGGLDQPTYLTQTKNAYINVLKDLHLTEEIDNVEPIVTDDIVITRPTLAFLEDKNGNRIPATSLDLLLYGTNYSWSSIIEASKKVPLKDLFYRLYPELYRDYCEHNTKDPEVLKLTEHDIEKFTGIDKKIPAWVKLV